MSKGKIVLGTIFGAVAGFAAGILSAPKSGKETRQDIKDAAKKTKDVAVEKAGEAKEATLRTAKDVKEKAEGVAGDVSKKVKEVAEDVTEKGEELVQRGNQAVEGAQKGFAKKPTQTKKPAAKK